MKNKLEEQFDGICNKAMPLILFSYWKLKEPLIEKLSSLFRAYNSNDIISFDEIAKQITTMIDEREIFDSEKERLIQVFSNRSKSYNDKFDEIYEEIRCLKKRTRSKKSFSERKSVKKEQPTQQLIPSPTKINKICPHCNYLWNYGGKGSLTRKGRNNIQCPKCKKWLK